MAIEMNAKRRAKQFSILHLADFVPPYVVGGGGAAISTSKIIDYLSQHTNYTILTRRFQDNNWNYKLAKVYPVLPKMIVIPNSIKEVLAYAYTNTVTRPYAKQLKFFVRKLHPNSLYVTGNTIPSMRAAIKTGIPVFIDVRDSHFLDPILGRRIVKDRNKFLHLYRHITERNRVPATLKPFTVFLVGGYYLYSILLRKLLLRDILHHHKTVHFITVSKYIKSQLIIFGIPERNIKCIYNIADIDTPNQILSPSQRENSVVFAGIIEAAKGIWTILDAAKILQNQKIKFKIFGDGADYAEAMEYVVNHHLSNVSLYGEKSHEYILKVYAKSKIIIAPSIWQEPFGRFILESITTRTPLITTNVGGNPEGIKDRKTGLLINPNDATELAADIEELFENDKLYALIVKNLQTEMVKYSSERIGRQRLNYMISNTRGKL